MKKIKAKQSKAKQERSVLSPPINLLARIKTRRPKTKTKQFGHVPSCDVCHDFFFVSCFVVGPEIRQQIIRWAMNEETYYIMYSSCVDV